MRTNLSASHANMSFRLTAATLILLASTRSGGTEEKPPANELPAGFVYADESIPDLVVELKYLSADNFVGARIDGYEANRCILTAQAVEALGKVQADVRRAGLTLKVFDSYRPQRAVDHFLRWSRDGDDQRMKATHYPDVDKTRLFKEGYVAERSGHSRGSTIDLTLAALSPSGKPRELDMGGAFDFFGRQSWPFSSSATPQQLANRLLLRSVMTAHGFRPYDKEWWHFTLRDEPFPETYFDFPVK